MEEIIEANKSVTEIQTPHEHIAYEFKAKQKNAHTILSRMWVSRTWAGSKEWRDIVQKYIVVRRNASAASHV